MEALSTVGDIREVWNLLSSNWYRTRSLRSLMRHRLTHENRFNVFAHLRIILFFFFIFFTAWTGKKRFMRYDSWVMCGECWVFFYGMCWNNENNILTVCITQNNSNLFQSCLKPEEIKNENIYMLNAGPDFRWKGKANKLPVLLVQHGDK